MNLDQWQSIILLSDSFRILLNLITCYNIKVTKFIIMLKEDNFIAVVDVALFTYYQGGRTK